MGFYVDVCIHCDFVEDCTEEGFETPTKKETRYWAKKAGWKRKKRKSDNEMMDICPACWAKHKGEFK